MNKVLSELPRVFKIAVLVLVYHTSQIKLPLFLWCLHIYEIMLLNFGFISLKNVILKYYEISRK